MGGSSSQPTSSYAQSNQNSFGDSSADNDPFGGFDNMYGGTGAPKQNVLNDGVNDMFGGMSNDYDAFSGADSNGMSQNEPFNAFGGSSNALTEKSKQDELFDMLN